MGCLKLTYSNFEPALKVVHKSLKISSKSYADSYRYGYNGEEGDPELKGEGNSYDYGNRMYDPRVGKFLSLDAYAAKYPSISPYAFAMNSPIVAKDVGGDSVLFYNEAGACIGYSHDNQRYKDKNLLVVIADKDIAAFTEAYNKTRGMVDDEDYPKGMTSHSERSKYREACVAGLESMGTSYDVNDFYEFYDDHIDKYRITKYNDSEARGNKPQVEWSASMYIDQSNKLDRGGSFAVDDQTETSLNAIDATEWANKKSGVGGDFHTHPADCKLKPSESPDWDRAKGNVGYWNVIVSDKFFQLYRLDNDGGTMQRDKIVIEKSDFKNPPIEKGSPRF